MQILAHRGYWLCKEEKNTLKAFQRAFENGFGIETDVRDFNGKLVISHDVAEQECLLFQEMARMYAEKGNGLLLALNVKADGIQKMLNKELKYYGIENYFMFDMSVPEQVIYVRQGFRTFTRMSEFEREPVMYEQIQGIWMDEFRIPWITEELIERYLTEGREIGIISPEIHNNETDRVWRMLLPYKESGKLILCTDEPMKARSFFNEKN